MDSDSTRDNVVTLHARRPMAPSALRETEAYWLALADGRLMPKRSEVDPRGLSGALDRVFLLERIAPSHARFRVAGSRLTRILDMEVRGLPFSTLFHAAARPDLGEALTAVFDEPARLYMRLDGAAGVFKTRVTAELLILPLRDDTGEVSRALGVLDWDANGPAPSRFRIGHQERRTLVGYAERPEEVQSPESLPLIEMRDLPKATHRPKKKGPGQRPTLTLVT